MAAGKDATLYDFPVSNNGGRCRVVIYDKGIQDKIEIKKPDGALSEINPQGKVPVLIDHSLNEFQIFESDTILRHLEVFGPLLTKWWENLLATEPAFQKDLAPATVFDKIIKKEIPSDVVYENDKVLAFRDIAPQAPIHILVIPKRRQGLTSLRKATEEQKGLLGEMMLAVAKVVKQEGIEGGYRLVVNDGEDAGQTVNHLHIHILAGRPLKWPPG
eukprot:evm.model.NODE_49408_length_6906_cov_25.972633.2